MNIFVLDECPKKSASMMFDKHIVKMPLESGQMTSTVIRKKYGVLGKTKSLDKHGNIKYKKRLLMPSLGETDGMWDKDRFETLYWDCHHKHPCTLWVGESKANWDWLTTHAIALSHEYTSRYKKVHATLKVIEWCKNYPVSFQKKELTTFALAMPNQYKKESAVDSYREYYKKDKSDIAVWRYSNPPTWW